MAQWIADKYGMAEYLHILNIAEKLIITLIIFIAVRFIVRIMKAVVKRTITKNDRLTQRKAKTLGAVATSVIKYVVYFITLCVVLNYWGIDVSSLITLGGVATVAIGLGSQSIIQDMMTGAFILTEDQFAVGDIITAEGYTGTVESIGLRTTVLRSADGNTHIIPNGQIKIVTNMSKGFNRGVVDICVAYEENLDGVFEVLNDEMEKIYKNAHIKGLIARPVILGVEDLGESCVTIRISADCNVGENWNVEREIRRLVKNRFDAEGIVIPYPQIVVTRKEHEQNGL